MLLITPPALTFLMQAVAEKEQGIVRVTYELLHVSPVYFLYMIDKSSPETLRPKGVQTIQYDNAKGKITVAATSTGHADLKPLLTRFDVVPEPEPIPVKKTIPVFSEVRLQMKGKNALDGGIIIAIEKDATAAFSLSEPISVSLCPLPGRSASEISFYRWRITPHFSPDEKTASLDIVLVVEQKPKDRLISLGTQTVTVGVNTKIIFPATMVLHDKQEFFVRVRRANPDDF
ncbi:hypothetical protein [Armatimonas sp.]|uniref:hypothetical protein n=1 Tax=Armatimonas sp. TaxID=1872638 RepID=UPI00286D3699|nr:hypothetical protein [Armatimonas sp.]